MPCLCLQVEYRQLVRIDWIEEPCHSQGLSDHVLDRCDNLSANTAGILSCLYNVEGSFLRSGYRARSCYETVQRCVMVKFFEVA